MSEIGIRRGALGPGLPLSPAPVANDPFFCLVFRNLDDYIPGEPLGGFSESVTRVYTRLESLWTMKPSRRPNPAMSGLMRC